ncbi:hypothetical protein BCR33DRAFT_798826 [Rhizoclosmatium globosum]|uniref:Uncharacterized protein n=1 Tax=Rhizoclosmatium globosum TaxID=329046 RepID=A0A1Y2ACV6_9FUNG|nr:hypothetical protein BCR33DRAFT_798826 [Rhizoclosmatium globosum]|eukprot:ORY20304.1 hypothetical protein BCR33DRAFT_798826 [Rhizoclosmatium globosum]
MVSTVVLIISLASLPRLSEENQLPNTLSPFHLGFYTPELGELGSNHIYTRFYTSHLHQDSTPAIYTSHLHQDSTPGFYTSHLHQPSTPGFYTSHLHQDSTPGFYTSHLHQLLFLAAHVIAILVYIRATPPEGSNLPGQFWEQIEAKRSRERSTPTYTYTPYSQCPAPSSHPYLTRGSKRALQDDSELPVKKAGVRGAAYIEGESIAIADAFLVRSMNAITSSDQKAETFYTGIRDLVANGFIGTKGTVYPPNPSTKSRLWNHIQSHWATISAEVQVFIGILSPLLHSIPPSGTLRQQAFQSALEAYAKQNKNKPFKSGR